MTDYLADSVFTLASRRNVADAALAVANARIAYRCAFEELKNSMRFVDSDHKMYRDHAAAMLTAYETALFDMTEIADDMVRSTYARNAA